MYDTEKLSVTELHILATYILPRPSQLIILFDQMLADLAPLSIRKLKGTIGALKGRYYEGVFLQSPYWTILLRHFSHQGICPFCKKTCLLVIKPIYQFHGINHLHEFEHIPACADCHQIILDHRFWLQQKDEWDVGQFLIKLRKYKY